MRKFINPLVLIWLVFCSIVLYIDAFYIINRPLTLKGGPYYWFFWPYQMYVKYDSLYVIQQWLNVVQSTLIIISLFLYASKSEMKRLWSALLVIIVSTMTLWKTVLYAWYGKDYTSPQVYNFTPQGILVYVIPTSIFIFIPILVIISVSKNITKFYEHKLKGE